MPSILYLVHDLSDPAVRRRVTMLEAGGATVLLAGFTRSDKSELAPGAVVLGRTHDGKFAQRLAKIGQAALGLRTALAQFPQPEIIIGRNLEMLALAQRAAGLYAPRPPVVYECLDIHRLLLGNGAAGRAMRAAERALSARSRLLITSSPAFVREYFEPRGQLKTPVLLLENQVLELEEVRTATPVRPAPPQPGEPWRIGWFGALRCRKSLSILSKFSRDMKGRVEIILRGRPSAREFPDLAAEIASTPFMRFEGPYRNPEDLARIYGEVHFAWAIDFFEEGLNSDWLLPNRLYESCRHGAVPIALSGTETGRFLAQRGLGVLVDAATPETLARLLPLADADYRQAQARILAEPASRWVCGPAECRALVGQLAKLARRGDAPATEMLELV